MATTRTASTHWEGSLFEGAGKVTLDSSGLGTFDVSWPARAEEANGKTSPEELIAAAHSACFSMAFSNGLAKAGTPPDRLDTSAEVDFVPGTGITQIRLTVRGTVEGMSEEDFVAAAEEAKAAARSARRSAVRDHARRGAGLTSSAALRLGVVRGRGRGLGLVLGPVALLLAVPHDPLGERDLDALVVEARLDPLAQLAGDRPLLHRQRS